MFDELPIETANLRIRQFRRDDVEAFFSWRSDEDVARYTLWNFPYKMEEAKTFCEEQAALTSLPVGSWCQLFIEEKDTGTSVGDIGLGLDVDGEGTLEIGYSIHKSFWGKGYATEAVGAALPVVSRLIGAKVVKAEVDARNPASGKVLSKLGFVPGSVQKKRSFIKGEWCDEIDYVLPVGS